MLTLFSNILINNDSFESTTTSLFLFATFNKTIRIFLLPWPPHYVVVWISSHGHPSLKLVSVFILGVVFIRVAGYVINNFVDSNIDQHIRRT